MRHHLSSVKLYEHRGVGLEVLDRHRESKLVEHEELNLQMVELCQRQPTHLFVSKTVSRQSHLPDGTREKNKKERGAREVLTLAYREFV